MKQKNAVLITGAGSIQNAWPPILEQFSKDFEFEIDPDGVSCYFARLIYLLRFYAADSFPEAKDYLKLALEETRIIKSKIADELYLAQESKIG